MKQFTMYAPIVGMDYATLQYRLRHYAFQMYRMYLRTGEKQARDDAYLCVWLATGYICGLWQVTE